MRQELAPIKLGDIIKEGAMNKTIVCFMAVAFLLVQGCYSANNSNNTTMPTQDRQAGFKISISNTMFSVVDKDGFINILPNEQKPIKVPVLIYDTNQIKFFGIDFKKPEDPSTMMQTPMSPSDPDYISKLTTIFTSADENYILNSIGLSVPKRFILLAVLPENKENAIPYESHMEIPGLEYVYGALEPTKCTIRNLIQCGIWPLNEGSIVYFDSHYNFQVWSYENKKLVLKKNEALNPDMVNIYNNPFMRRMAGAVLDEPSTMKSDAKGFIWMKLGERRAYVKGKPVEMDVPLEVSNGWIYGPLDFLTYHLDVNISMINLTYGDMVFQRKEGRKLTYDDWPTETKLETPEPVINQDVDLPALARSGRNNITSVTANYNLGSESVGLSYGDGDDPGTYYLQSKPFTKSEHLMVPYTRFSNLLGSDCLWRPIDKTILIPINARP